MLEEVEQYDHREGLSKEACQELLAGSASLQKVARQKRAQMYYLLKSKEYQEATHYQDAEDVHALINAVLGKATNSRTTYQDLLKRFRRVIALQAKHSPTDEMLTRDSNEYSLLEYTYSLPVDLDLKPIASEEKELEELLELSRGLLSVFRAVQTLQKERRRGMSAKYMKQKRTEIIEKCKGSLGKYTFLKEHGFQQVMRKVGIDLIISPQKLSGQFSKLLKKPGMKGHVKRIEALEQQVTQIVETFPKSD